MRLCCEDRFFFWGVSFVRVRWGIIRNTYKDKLQVAPPAAPPSLPMMEEEGPAPAPDADVELAPTQVEAEIPATAPLTKAEGPMGAGLAGLVAALESSEGTLTMRQQWSMLEAATGGAFERANVYDIYRGESMEDGDKFIQAKAVSTNCERQCCAPNHSLIIQINDASTGETYISIQRPGWGSGKYCLGACPACADMCRDGVIIHDGLVTAEPTMCNLGTCCCDGCGQEVANPNPISKAEVPHLGGGGCTPTVHVFENHDSEAPNGVVTGPKIFGGCTELCLESKFVYSTMDGRDIGRVRKLVPQSCGQVCQELCTDSDRYRISLYEAASGEEKANMIAVALLADYMFFERDMGVVTCGAEPGPKGPEPFIKCTFCLCSIFGCICPCALKLKKSSGGDGGGGGAPPAPEAADGLDAPQIMERA